MKTIKEVIENLKGGKSAYECLTICRKAKETINENELSKLEEMIEYYGGTHSEIDQLNDNFVEVV